MLSPEYLQYMARYGRWQNKSLVSAASELTDEERREDRGAFFRSIHNTFCHVLFADRAWFARLSGTKPPPPPAVDMRAEDDPISWEAFKVERAVCDEHLIAWTTGLTQDDVNGTLQWHSYFSNRDFDQPRGMLFGHLFNHQTHHRGQIHQMLTALGKRMTDTDMPFMPEEEFSV